MKYFQEVTSWTSEFPVQNHVYYMDDAKTQAVGYIPQGKKRLVKFSRPMKIETRGRKFVVVKAGEADAVYFAKEQETSQPTGAVELAGSSGKKYFLTNVGGKWTCTCPGFMFRRTCKHSTGMGDGAKI